jgi:hypothetical protein
MNTLFLQLGRIKTLNGAKEALESHRSLTDDERQVLMDFLANLPLTESLLEMQLPFNAPVALTTLSLDDAWQECRKWRRLFSNLPRGKTTSGCLFIDELLSFGIADPTLIMVGLFTPSFEYDQKDIRFRVYFKNDGSSRFWFPTFEDAQRFPALYSFVGNWIEAYYEVIRTVKEGWPQEKFPEELKKILSE